MKFIRQYISEENIQVGTQLDESTGEKSYFIEGIFMQGDKENRNKRLYPTSVISEQLNEYKRSFIEKKRAFGELGHPQGPQINLDRVSHMITEIRQDGSNFIGKAKIMDTPYGKIVKNFIDEGALLGVSSRGLGSVKSNKNGISEVQNDFKLSTVDIVADPSAPDAFVEGIMENYDWYYDNGILKSRQIEEIRKSVKSAKSRKELQERKIEAFQKFLESL